MARLKVTAKHFYMSGVDRWLHLDRCTILADTGYYDNKTNADQPNAKLPRVRYMVVTHPEYPDILVLQESASMVTSAGSLGISGKGNLTMIPPKSKEPHLMTMRRVFKSEHDLRSHFYRESKDEKITFESRYLHPRFTKLKAYIRELGRVRTKREAALKAAREKINAKITMNFAKLSSQGD